MVLNSYFLQGSTGEQSLMQDLVNEHIQIHGIEVYYLPRKIFKTEWFIQSKAKQNQAVKDHKKNSSRYFLSKIRQTEKCEDTYSLGYKGDIKDTTVN